MQPVGLNYMKVAQCIVRNTNYVHRLDIFSIVMYINDQILYLKASTENIGRLAGNDADFWYWKDSDSFLQTNDFLCHICYFPSVFLFV